MKKLSLATLTAAQLFFAGAALATPTHVIGNNSGATALSNTITMNIRSDAAAVASGDSILGAVVGDINDSNIVSITDDQGGSYPVVATLNSTDHANPFAARIFKGINLTKGPKKITVTFAGPEAFRVIATDEYSGVGDVDTVGGPGQASAFLDPSTSTAWSSGSITTGTAGDLVYGAVVGGGVANITAAGSGFMFRQQCGNGAGCTSNFYMATEDQVQTSAGSIAGTFTASANDAAFVAVVALKPSSGGAPPFPTAISCSPAALADNTVSGTTVCAMTVTMSDLSTYTGANTFNPSNIITVPGTGNGNVTLANTLTSGNDGSNPFTLTATENGVSLTKMFSMTVTPATVAGNPYALSWKNVDPNGATIFTAPRAMTINELALRITVPPGAPAVLDAYKVPGDTPCAQGTKIHSGDFNANSIMNDNVQTLPIVVSSLGIYDSVCIVTQQPFPVQGQATLTVTAN